MLLKACPNCHKEIPRGIALCPYCRKDEQGRVMVEALEPSNAPPDSQVQNDLARLENDDPVIRDQGVEQLVQRGASIVPTLVGVLSEQSRRGLSEIAKVLGRLRDRRAISVLIQVMKTGDEPLRAAAVWALAQFRDPQVLPELMAETARFDPTIQAYLAFTLGTFRDPQVTPALTKLTKHPHVEVAFQAAWALGETGDAQAVAPLRRLLSRKDPLVRSAASVSLQRLGAPVRRAMPVMVYVLGGLVILGVAVILGWYAYK